MKTFTTNYFNTFIQVADDCPAAAGEIPAIKGDTKTVARLQYELIKQNPYKYTSDDLFFQIHARRNELTESELSDERTRFFSKGQPCFRASPLTKRYGWGVHSDNDGRIAIYGCETEEYKRLSEDSSLKIVKGMRSSR